MWAFLCRCLLSYNGVSDGDIDGDVVVLLLICDDAPSFCLGVVDDFYEEVPSPALVVQCEVVAFGDVVYIEDFFVADDILSKVCSGVLSFCSVWFIHVLFVFSNVLLSWFRASAV